MSESRLKVQTSAVTAMTSVSRESGEILLLEFLERCYNQFRVIYADIEEAKTKNLKGSA
jgi:hypothetical protein